MVDRSSRPHRSPNRTPTRTERRIIKVRVIRRWGPARIAHPLGLNVSTVDRVLTRFGLAKLRSMDRATGRVIRRIETTAYGELVHVDVKKLGRIPAGGGWRNWAAPSAITTPRPTRVRDVAAGAVPRCGCIISCIRPSMRTPGWSTARSCPTNEKTPRQTSGLRPTHGSPSVASLYETC